jgi:hypothetical protein
MNTIVIDGYNLIHRVDELLAVAEKEEFESARNELEWTVSSYLAERKGVRAVVVYDSSHVQGKATGKRSYPGVGVRFAPCADDLVVELALKYAREGDSVRVISSDRAGIGSQLAGERRIEVLSSDKFWSTTLAAKGGRKAGAGSKAGLRTKTAKSSREEPGKVSKTEVEYWLRAFGETGKEEKGEGEPVENAVEHREIPGRKPDQSDPSLKEIRKRRYLRSQKRRR